MMKDIPLFNEIVLLLLPIEMRCKIAIKTGEPEWRLHCCFISFSVSFKMFGEWQLILRCLSPGNDVWLRTSARSNIDIARPGIIEKPKEIKQQCKPPFQVLRYSNFASHFNWKKKQNNSLNSGNILHHL